MKVLNLIWGVNLGGVDKCFLTYANLGNVEPRLDITSVCISLPGGDNYCSTLSAKGIEVIKIKGRFDFSWIVKLRRLLKQKQPDLVFTHAFNGPILMVIERLLGDRTPVACSYHGEYHATALSRKFLSPLFNWAMHSYYRHCASGILTVCHYSSRFLIDGCKIPSAQVHCVHNGLPDIAATDCQASPIQLHGAYEGKIVLGIASRLDAVKGIDDLITAISFIRDLPIHLLVLGSGESENFLRQQVSQLHLDSHVTFMGFQSDITRWLRLFDIFMLPSHAEYHSIALLEAMRAELPIIATDVGGNGESVRDHQEALLVPAHNPEALAKAIRTLANDPALRKTLAQNARKRFLAEFTEEKMCRKLADWLLSFDTAKS